MPETRKPRTAPRTPPREAHEPADPRERLFAEVERGLVERLPPPRAAAAASLFRLVHARTNVPYLAALEPSRAIEQAAGLFELIEEPVEGFRVRVHVEPVGPPAAKEKRTVLETVGRDQPFIVDSLFELIRVRGRRLIESFHPIVAVERGKDGAVTAVGPPAKGAELLSIVRIEIEGAAPREAREAITTEAGEVLEEARIAVRDFEPMLARLRSLEGSLAARLERVEDRVEADEAKEASAFLAWLSRANFVFLGSRSYAVRWEGREPVVEPTQGSGLGIFRDETRLAYEKSPTPSGVPDDLRARVASPHLILVHKARVESRVLRRARMDFIAVKRVDGAGRVAGLETFAGLFTARAYNDLPSDIPILRRKLESILDRAGIVPGSHDHKEVFSIFTSIPKSELFVTDSEKIAEMIFSVMAAAQRRDVRVSYRPDLLERGVSVMVLLPRERFNADVRVAIQSLLAGEFKGTLVDYRLALSEEPMARLHFYFATPPGKIPEPALDSLEAKVAELTRTWHDRLKEALEREHGPSEAARIALRYEKAFPGAYSAQKSPETAVADIRHIDTAASEGRLETTIAQGKTQKQKKVSVLKIFRPDEPFALSTLMPVLTHLDLQVLDEQTFRVAPRAAEEPSRGKPEAGRRPGVDAREVYIHSFRVLASDGSTLTAGPVVRNIDETIRGVLAGELDDDPLNALVTRAGLDPLQVAVLRAYDAYIHQLGSPWSQRTTYAALCDHPTSALALVRLFEARFDPRLDAAAREGMEGAARKAFLESLEQVAGIHEDQVLRRFENLILSSVRTNWFARDARGKRLPALAVKLRCADVQGMPDPRPLHEILVHSPHMEGVHLRSGKVARGGIRWSSRVDDYRMEILGLMKAQRTKNAVIVPVGAKGGFILKRAPSPSPPADEVRRRYEVFIGALLDVTDNIDSDRVVHPRDVVVHDEEDPYLVVAADRGTAGFSDTANAIAQSRSFWLGDAFASGGSRGYNHKKEGITARGVWECVRRHFREMGRDADRETFTAMGIGDMSGDVFGNGMLLSRKIRLLAAFNHVHVFIDPDPDPEASFEERRRLFDLPTSSWTDYDRARISKGGGVHRRDAKAIELSPEVRKVLDIPDTVLNGEALVSAILKMPVDLLWNGGIGTYVKARTESHQDVGDPANDTVRIEGADLRAKVVAEGGNLGFTQLGRIEYARAGGRINTDFIDNSAGVDLSDHEVNLKILLASAAARDGLGDEERDEVLRTAGPDVIAQVLRDNHLQGRVLSIAERKAPLQVDEHRFLIEDLSVDGLLQRKVEKLPAAEEILRLRESRMGLVRPHLSVLLAYAKIDTYTKVLSSRLPDTPELEALLVAYFPAEVARRFPGDVRRHRLRREIAATTAVNAAINEMGITFFHRIARQTGAGFDGILAAFLVASALAEGKEFETIMDRIYADGFADMSSFYDAHERFRAGEESAVLLLLKKGLADRPVLEVISDYSKRLEELRDATTAGSEPPARPRRGPPRLPEEVWKRVLASERLSEDMQIADLRRATGAAVPTALLAWREAGSLLLLERVEDEAARIPLVTSEEVQACVRLLEEARAHRARLATEILERLGKDAGGEATDAQAAARIVPAGDKDRLRVIRLLEAARAREPLTVSGLFVIVDALGRIAERAENAS
jgi:glutamate dehydrogenase